MGHRQPTSMRPDQEQIADWIGRQSATLRDAYVMAVQLLADPLTRAGLNLYATPAGTFARTCKIFAVSPNAGTQTRPPCFKK